MVDLGPRETRHLLSPIFSCSFRQKLCQIFRLAPQPLWSWRPLWKSRIRHWQEILIYQRVCIVFFLSEMILRILETDMFSTHITEMRIMVFSHKSVRLSFRLRFQLVYINLRRSVHTTVQTAILIDIHCKFLKCWSWGRNRSREV